MCPPEKGKANHFSILALKIPWTEEPGRFTGYHTVHEVRKESDATGHSQLQLKE